METQPLNRLKFPRRHKPDVWELPRYTVPGSGEVKPMLIIVVTPSSHWLSGWPKQSPSFIFTTKMVFPKSLKFMNSGSESSSHLFKEPWNNISICWDGKATILDKGQKAGSAQMCRRIITTSLCAGRWCAELQLILDRSRAVLDPYPFTNANQL